MDTVLFVVGIIAIVVAVIVLGLIIYFWAAKGCNMLMPMMCAFGTLLIGIVDVVQSLDTQENGKKPQVEDIIDGKAHMDTIKTIIGNDTTCEVVCVWNDSTDNR